MRGPLICLACLLLGAAATASAQQPTYWSAERVRAALLKPPPKLIVPTREPNFRVNIQERRPFDDLFEVRLWDTPAIGPGPSSTLAPIEGVPHSTPALVQYTVDPGNFAKSAAKTVRDKSVRSQVDRAVAQYCAAQPDAGSSIPLCWSTSATSR
jgi:hypothetical protein